MGLHRRSRERTLDRRRCLPAGRSGDQRDAAATRERNVPERIGRPPCLGARLRWCTVERLDELYVVAPVDSAPVVNATNLNVTASHGQNIAVSSLFSVHDAEGDAITAYQFWDFIGNPIGGHWVVGGAAQPAGQAIDVTSLQFSSATFQSGSGTGSSVGACQRWHSVERMAGYLRHHAGRPCACGGRGELHANPDQIAASSLFSVV